MGVVRFNVTTYGGKLNSPQLWNAKFNCAYAVSHAHFVYCLVSFVMVSHLYTLLLTLAFENGVANTQMQTGRRANQLP